MDNNDKTSIAFRGMEIKFSELDFIETNSEGACVITTKNNVNWICKDTLCLVFRGDIILIG